MNDDALHGCRNAAVAESHANLAAMIRRLLAFAVTLSVAACATPASHAPATAATAPAATPANAVLPIPPQPPERPLAPPALTDPSIPLAQRQDAFVEYTARSYGIDPGYVRGVLAQAQFQQRIVDIMSRPAEAVRPWKDYRPIFLNDARIDGGVAFYLENRTALDRIAAATGVPAEYIVAIIGVETQFGRNMGSYRVLDALYTLAFFYPKRAPFFAGELAQLFALQKAEPQLDILQLKGSYAGAMGMGQFMPSSYRLWAKDGDGDGRRDLLTHKPDVFASIANYFVVHGWQRGQPVVARAEKDPNLPEWTPATVEPLHTLAALEDRGYRVLRGEPRRDGATVINFEGAAGREHWLGYGNFYVITRYNRSPMYALAVHQLAQAIRARADGR